MRQLDGLPAVTRRRRLVAAARRRRARPRLRRGLRAAARAEGGRHPDARLGWRRSRTATSASCSAASRWSGSRSSASGSGPRSRAPEPPAGWPACVLYRESKGSIERLRPMCLNCGCMRAHDDMGKPGVNITYETVKRGRRCQRDDRRGGARDDRPHRRQGSRRSPGRVRRRLAVDRAGPFAQRAARRPCSDGQDLGHDGGSDLLGAVGTDVEAGRCVERGQIRWRAALSSSSARSRSVRSRGPRMPR